MMKKSFIAFLFLTIACSSSEERPDRAGSIDRPLIDEKYSLQADRKELEEIRSQIPAERRQKNDEMAFIWELMSDPQRPPSEVRQKFDSAVRKKRDLFDRDLKKERETFTKEERKKREAFLKDLQQQRDAFNKLKKSREEKSEFYRDVDAKRSEFFSEERDQRADFESDIRERRKSFDDYVRQKQNEFNQEHRAFTKRHEQWKKEKADSEKGGNPAGSAAVTNSEAAELERELRELQARPGTSLESGE